MSEYRAKWMEWMHRMRRRFSHPSLWFDRTFSRASFGQLLLLCMFVLGVFLFLFIVSCIWPLHETKENAIGSGWRLITLLIDPGALDNVQQDSIPFGIGVAVLGLLLITGCCVSVVTNLLSTRGEKARNGETHYRFRNHVVVLGMDDLVPSLIDQICHEPDYLNTMILVQSTMDAEMVRSKIYDMLEKHDEDKVVIYRGKRNSREDLKKLDIIHAKAVFLIGECGESDRDSINIDSLRLIGEICKNREKCSERPLQIAVQFDFQTTFAAFQVTDLADEWREQLDFHPFNFYESWAKKLLVTRRYKGHQLQYPPLDREPIDYESEKTVHLVIVGMSSMGVALGTFAAHILHFPNFCRDHTKRSRITFIDAKADREMDFFRNRYRSFFEISSTTYIDMSGEEIHEQRIAPEVFSGDNADFLDVEFVFIKGRVESPKVQCYLRSLTMDIHCITTISVCLKESVENMDVALSLPNEIYDSQIPVFVRLKSSDALLSMLNESSVKGLYCKYANLYPFGMLEKCYDMDHDKQKLAQWINYQYGPNASAKYDDQVGSQEWRNLPTALQWSNLYNAYSLDIKIRSFDIKPTSTITDDDITLLCKTEHNRWCVEKLLLGYRKPTVPEMEIIRKGGERLYNGKMVSVAKWYKNHFIHPDLVPNEQLAEESIIHDKDIIYGIIKYVLRDGNRQ